MSGISGVLRFDKRAVDPNDLDKMAVALVAHGPDQKRLFTSGAVGLAHVLMRMQPEDIFDQQPFRGASGAAITADIRIDNRTEMISELGIDPAQARLLSDAVITLAAWERWGDSVWAKLRGPFAVAIWDPRLHRLTLARDPIGLKVVFWYRCERFFVFATMPKGLFASKVVPRRLNEEKVADFLVLNHKDHRTTVYRDVVRVPPAHFMHIEIDGRTTTRRYWSPNDIPSVKLASDQDYAEGMRECLDRAVRRQSRSLHPVGAFLSGGLDSSAVAALAAQAFREASQRLVTFTAVPREDYCEPMPNGWYADETPYVEAIRAAVANIEPVYICNWECDEFAELESILPYLESPFRNVTNLGWMTTILRSARARGIRVLLGGDLGNFTISWDGWEQSLNHLMQGRLIRAFQQLRLLYKTTPLKGLTAFRTLFVNPLLPRIFYTRLNRIPHGGEGAWQKHAPIKAEFAKEMDVEKRALDFGHDFFARPHRLTLERRLQYLTTIDYLGDWRAAALAFSGVETRDPTADLDVVKFCLGVPPEQYLAEGIDRSLIRRAMWGILPFSVLANRKRGLPGADWFEKLGRRRVELESEVAWLAKSPLAKKIIDHDRLATAVHNWPATGGGLPANINEYQLCLSRGLGMGRFIRWYEQTADSQ